MEQLFLDAYETHADAIFRHVYYRTFSKARAEELVQETFMKTWNYLAAGKKVDNIRAFLYRVAGNLVIDESRKHKEGSLDEMLEDEGFQPSSDEHVRLQSSVEGREIMDIMKSLPESEREIIIMRFVNDMDPREIAEVLKISANTASVRIHRATASLKKEVLKKNG